MSQNTALRQASEAWLRAALAFLQTVPSLPYFEDIDVTFEPDDRYSTHSAGLKIDAERIVINYCKELFNLPEYETKTYLLTSGSD